MATKPISAEAQVHSGGWQESRIDYRRILGFAFICAIPMVIVWEAIRQVVSLALTNDTYTHIPLIPIVSAFLIYTNRQAIRSRISTQWQPGMLLLAAGFAAVIAARLGTAHMNASQDLSLAMLSVVLVWMGAFAVCFGYAAFRAARFPLLFLIFTVPIPEPILSQTIHFLQVWSAHSAAALFGLFGIPYLQNDLVFNLPGVAIRVAEECSGIRSTLALLFLKTTWKQFLVCLLAVPLSIAKNGLRIAALSALAIYVNPGFLYGKLHQYGGMFFFAAAFVPLALLFVILERGDSKHVESK